MAYKENARASINRNNLKLTADKVIQILDQVRDEGKKSRRRWIWELMQNAKDVPNKYGRVSVYIELSEGQLTFKHNGDPFLVENITGIIQQVSTKPSNVKDSETTGKFGTGFIATHLLSDKVTIGGIVQEPSEPAKRFQFELDRSGKTSEELMPSIDQALLMISEIDDNSKFPIVESYASLRTEKNLENIFTYPLVATESKSAANEGVEDLKITLPLTLAFLPRIKQVRVVNQVTGEDLTYQCDVQKEKTGFSVVVINILNNISTKVDHEYYIIYSEDDISLAAQVSDLKSYELVVRNNNQPFLYRDFPLIGTENFYLPFILNSRGLYPTEKRDGVLLNGSGEKPASSREAISKGFQAALKLLDALIDLKATNLFVAALSRLPKCEFEEDTKQWYVESIQKSYRNAITSRKMIKAPGENDLSPAETAFPRSANSKLNELFWNLCSPFLNRAVPEKEKLDSWLYHIGPESEAETWEYKLYYEIDDLLKEIEEKVEIKNIELTSEKTIQAYEWLSDVYQFTVDRGEIELLDKYAVLPNQYGRLKRLGELFIEHPEGRIPDQLLDVLKTLGKDWRDEIISRELKFAIPSHQTRDTALISTTINEILAAEQKGIAVKENIFLKRSDALQILTAILRIDPIESTQNAFRHKLFNSAKGLFHFEDNFVKVKNISQFKFEQAIKLTIIVMNNAISSAKDIDGLSSQLKLPEEKTILWLDTYLRLLQSNSEFKHLLEEGNIVPNRYKVLCGYKDLFNFGTSDQLLDETLLSILHEFDKGKDWYPVLIADGIGIQLPNTKTFEQLGKAVQECIVGIRGNESHETHSKPILDLINWASVNERLAMAYLPGFVNLKTEFFFKVTIGKDEAANKHIFNILKNKENLEILSELSSSGVDLSKLRRMNFLSQEVGYENAIESLEELYEEKVEFNIKQQIGHSVEELLLELLASDLTNLEVKFIGTGPFDFLIKNKTNAQEYFLELKSIKEGSLDPIRMAISQARHAVAFPDRYALCVFVRPKDPSRITKPYMRENLKCVYQVGVNLKDTVDESNTIDAYLNSSKLIKLEVKNREMKVALGQDYISRVGKSFESLRTNIVEKLR